MTIRKALLAASFLAVPAVAGAQPVSGLYIGAGAGANWVNPPSHIDLTGPGFGLPAGVTVNNAGKAVFHTAGPVWSARVGASATASAPRSRATIARTAWTAFGGFDLAPVGQTGGFQRTYGVMANVFYDFDPGFLGIGPSYIQPYIGAGVGYAWTDWRNVRGNSVPTGLALNIDDTQGSFAFQGIAGIAAPLTWAGITGLTLTVEYRFFGTLEPELNGTLVNPVTRIPPAAIRAATTTTTRSCSACATPGRPPPAPPRRAGTGRRARARAHLPRLLRLGSCRPDGACARDHRRGGGQLASRPGDADRGGRPCRPLRHASYNQRLSQRRADAVAAELVARGVPRNIITVQAFGESRPLVPTADGVREPQNRRVEIVLR